MTNERLLAIILIIFVLGAISYFVFAKLQKEVINVSAFPSPSPLDLNFITDKKPPEQSQSPVADSSLPLEHNKKLGKFPGILTPENLSNKKVVITTGKGVIELEVYPEASMAASNFMLLADNGFYNGLTFHRVESGFVIQGGDPSGNGTDGPGYRFPDEVVTRDYTKGTVAMANAGPNTNGSQFFIMLEDHPELPKQYTIFGKVISGMDVVEKITAGDIMQRVVVQHLQ